MTPRKPWVPPKLLVLVRTAPQDGVMQVVICKIVGIVGPGDDGGPVDGCVIPAPGVPVCNEIQAS